MNDTTAWQQKIFATAAVVARERADLIRRTADAVRPTGGYAPRDDYALTGVLELVLIDFAARLATPKDTP